MMYGEQQIDSHCARIAAFMEILACPAGLAKISYSHNVCTWQVS
jgi:hypothetical protein